MMKNYWLNENIFICFGKKKSVIYNLTEVYVKIIWNNQEQTEDIINYITKDKNTKYIQLLYDSGLLLKEKLETASNTSVPVNLNLFKFAWIEITNKCNFKCIHCYGSFSPSNFLEMNINDIKLITKELLQLNITAIQIIGGEPFVLERNKFKNILEYLAEHFKNIEIYTNGYFLDVDWLKFLRKHNFVLSMSVYHHTKDIHNRITQNKYSFDNLTNLTKLLDDYNIKYRLGYTKTKFNKDYNKNKIQQNFNLNENIKLKFDTMRVSGRGDLKLLDDDILNEKAITLSNFKNLTFKSKDFINNLKYHNCFSKKFYITAGLDIYPCVMERRISYGNLKEKKLRDILVAQSDVINLTKDDIEDCRECEFKYACFDCRPDSTSENFKAKPYYCKYNPKKGIWND